jgi:hypothetical protein
MNANPMITAESPVFKGREIQEALATAKGQQVLAYINASPTIRDAIAAMQGDSNPQTIQVGFNTQYDLAERVALLAEHDWRDLDAGTIFMRLAHEIGHARDLDPPASAESFQSPGAYAEARAANEGSAYWFEFRARQDIIAYNKIYPVPSGRLPVPETTVDAFVAEQPYNSELSGHSGAIDRIGNEVNARYSDPTARHAAARIALGGLSNALRPGNDADSTNYRDTNIRYFVVWKMGLGTSPDFAGTIDLPQDSKVKYEEFPYGGWTATIRFPKPEGISRWTEVTYTQAPDPEPAAGGTLTGQFQITTRVFELIQGIKTPVSTTISDPNTRLTPSFGTPGTTGTPVSWRTSNGQEIFSALMRPDGTLRSPLRNELGVEIGYVDSKTSDDGSRLVQTVREGTNVLESYDENRRLSSRISTNAAGVQVYERFSGAGARTMREETRNLGNGYERSTLSTVTTVGEVTIVRDRVISSGNGPSEWAQVSRTVNRFENGVRVSETFDGDEQLTERVQSRSIRLVDGSQATEQITTDVVIGTTRRQVNDQNGNAVLDEQVIDPVTYRTAEGFALAATDALSAVNAFARGDQVTGTLGTLRTVTRVVGIGTTSTELSAAGGVLDGLLSLSNLRNAVRGGDEFSIFSASANTLNVINRTLPQALAGSTPLSGTLNSVLNGTGANGAGEFAGLIQGGVPGVIPVVTLISGIRSQDPIAVTQGLIGLLNPSLLAGPVGWFLAAASILRAIDSANDVPFQWGTAKFKFGTNPQNPNAVTVDISGQGSLGYGKMNEAVYGTQGTSAGLLPALESIVAQAPTAADGSKLVGIIPQRMPAIGWNESRYESLVGYRVHDVDPATGLQKSPDLRWDDNFSAYNATPGNAEQQQTLPQTLLRSALAREAIAPLWEVRTARLQEQAGDPYAGLSELERAARIGVDNGVQTTARYNPTTGLLDNAQFRPISLDLSGNGRIDTVSNSSSNITFDWDDSGYQKQVEWLNTQDAFLALDRNLDGRIDTGSELFSNSKLADSVKGTRSLNWVDADANGLINANDPVYNALRVWRDLNGNGIADTGSGSQELQSLSGVGISQLSIASGRFTRQGLEFLMSSTELDADDQGVRATGVTGGIQVQFSGDALPTIYVTNFAQVTQNPGNPSGGTNTLTASADSFAVDEDGGADASDGRQAQSKSTAIKIKLSELLQNDAGYNGSMSQVGFAGVFNAANCSISYVAGSDEISIQLPQHATQTASFTYRLVAPTNPAQGQTQQTLDVPVTLMINPIDDRPIVSVEMDSARPVYGYGGYFDLQEGGLDADGVPTTALHYQPNQGRPIYEPYQTMQGRRVYYVDTYGTTEVQYGELTDTGVVVGDLSLRPEASGNQPFSVTVGGFGYLVDPNAARVNHSFVLSDEPANDGWIRVSDPDTSNYLINVTEQPNSGRVDFIDSSTGRFSYTGFRPVDQDLYGNLVRQNVYTDQYVRNEAFTNDFFKVTLQSGFHVRGSSFGPHTVDVVHYGPKVTNVAYGGKTPIALDMDGDSQVRFNDVDVSDVFFEVNESGWKRKIAWLKPSEQGGHDGFLAYDKDEDGLISWSYPVIPERNVVRV